MSALVGCALHWKTGWLKDLAVRASERGHGLGAALVQQGLAEFARRGFGQVSTRVAMYTSTRSISSAVSSPTLAGPPPATSSDAIALSERDWRWRRVTTRWGSIHARIDSMSSGSAP